jgi:hypothetical protein
MSKIMLTIVSNGKFFTSRTEFPDTKKLISKINFLIVNKNLGLKRAKAEFRGYTRVIHGIYTPFMLTCQFSKWHIGLPTSRKWEQGRMLAFILGGRMYTTLNYEQYTTEIGLSISHTANRQICCPVTFESLKMEQVHRLFEAI